MASSHFLSTSEITIDRKVGPVSIHSDVDTAALPEATAEIKRLTKSVIRKVDWRMLPLLGMLSAISLIDRSNLGLARASGMGRDLGLSIESRYSIVSCIYFIPYIIFQLPSNIFLRKLGVTHWLSFLVVSFGAVELAMGFVPSWGYLGLCRVLLGAFEAGSFPAMVYIITTWYTRHEVQTRLAAFYIVGIVVGGFSAIFAFFLTLLGGRYGIAGWAWIFIIEGAITIGFGIIAWFFLPNFPDQNIFLTREETQFVLQRVERDRGDSVPDVLTKEKLIGHLLDWKVWTFGIMYMCVTMPAYSISYFVTLILRGMGWSVTASLLLSAPPYVFAAASIMFFSWVSDRYRQRAAVIAVQACITLVGLFLTGFTRPAAWRYAGIFLTNAGSAGCIPGILAYSSNNIVSQTKRAVTTAIIVAFGGVGGIFASLVYRQADFPVYRPGIYATIACQILLLLLLAITTAYYRTQNKNLRLGTVDKPLEGQAGFVYTL